MHKGKTRIRRLLPWGAFGFGGRPNPPAPFPPWQGQATREGGELLPSLRRGGAGGGVWPQIRTHPSHGKLWLSLLY
jgi:hypothetical protein